MTTRDDDSELLRRVRGGDGQALGDLFARHRDRLRRMVQLRLDQRG
jgi:RNA polymerase sigma-70 factor, ECF subfamily